jgi:hypothetical protein
MDLACILYSLTAKTQSGVPIWTYSKIKMTQHNAGNVAISQLWEAFCASMKALTPWYDIPLQKENYQLPQYVDYNMFFYVVSVDHSLKLTWLHHIALQFNILLFSISDKVYIVESIKVLDRCDSFPDHMKIADVAILDMQMSKVPIISGYVVLFCKN